MKRSDTTRVWQLMMVLIFPLKLQTRLSYLRSQGVTEKLLTRGPIYIEQLKELCHDLHMCSVLGCSADFLNFPPYWI